MITAKVCDEILSLMKAVCAKMDISLELLHTRTRKRAIVCVRQGITRAIREQWEEVTLVQIGEHLCPEKPFNHTNTIMALKAFKALLDVKDKYAVFVNAKINECLNELFNPKPHDCEPN